MFVLAATLAMFSSPVESDSDKQHPTAERVAEVIEARFQELKNELKRITEAPKTEGESKARLLAKAKQRLAEAESNPRRLLKLPFVNLESQGALGFPLGEGKGPGAKSEFLSPDDTTLRVRVLDHRSQRQKNEPGGVYVRVVDNDGKLQGNVILILRSKLDAVADNAETTIDFALYNAGTSMATMPKSKKQVRAHVLKPLDVVPGVEHWLAARKEGAAKKLLK